MSEEGGGWLAAVSIARLAWIDTDRTEDHGGRIDSIDLNVSVSVVFRFFSLFFFFYFVFSLVGLHAYMDWMGCYYLEEYMIDWLGFKFSTRMKRKEVTIV